MASSLIVKVADGLDWKVAASVQAQCGGSGFFQHGSIPKTPEGFQAYAEGLEADVKLEEANGGDAATNGKEGDKDYRFRVDLFNLTEKQLDKLNYYQVLQLPFMAQLTPDELRQAYRKACLKYHPDKSGRGQDDFVFLKVQAAFETLTNQKQAYDSTEMPFDESIPSGDETADDFFDAYAIVFERNLHFDTRLLNKDAKKGGNNNGNGNKKRRNRKNRNNNKQPQGPPALGDDATPIEDVHRFYDYWAHFTTWRDFTIKAARELETEDQLEQAESRYEKRWYQREIDRLAKKLKQKEQVRITTLVERAMASDPRLKAEKQRLIDEKLAKQKQKEQAALDKQRQEQEAKEAEERKAQLEKEKRAQDKFAREKEKKLFRKTKQAFRRSITEALLATSQSEHSRAEDVELVCDEWDREAITQLNQSIAAKSGSPNKVLKIFTRSVNRIKGIETPPDDDDDDDDDDGDAANGGAPTNGALPSPKKKSDNKPQVVKIVSVVKEKKPFTKEELSALAKAVKKYPPGGANRWDAIATFINNLCKPQDPRTKEQCIETYNKLAKKPNNNSNAAAAPAPAAAPVDGWTEEQDKLLQASLAKYPASMDKNERWTSIAKEVPGKNKKDCVTRFKAIRDAIKNKK